MGQYKIVTDLAELESVKAVLEMEGVVSIDLETTSLDVMSCDILGVGLCAKPGIAWFVVTHSKWTDTPKENLAVVKKICEDVMIRKIGHNIKYDMNVFRAHGITLKNIEFDTYIASRILCYQQCNLEALTQLVLKRTATKYKDLVNIKKGETLLDVELDKVVDYGCEDVDTTLQLYHVFKKELQGDKVFYDMEMPLLEIVGDMEFNGVTIDTNKFEEVLVFVKSEIERLKGEIYKYEGVGEFNINSGAQRSHVFFNTLKMTKYKETKKAGVWCSDEKTRNKLKRKHKNHADFITNINTYIKYKTLQTRYLEPIPKKINEKTGRLHPSINQLGAETGRFSISNPALQQIPAHSEIARKMRSAFIAKNADHSLISADYSQVELRVLAHAAGEKLMLDAFNNKRDLHRETAQRLYRREDVTDDERSICKTINFAVSYGATAHTIAENYNFPEDVAQNLIDKYLETYKSVSRYKYSQIAKSRGSKEVYTLYGRRRRLYNIDDSRYWIRQADERKVLNTIIQGSSADILKYAMIKLLTKLDKRVKLLLQVHDELVFECPNDILEETKVVIMDTMKTAIKLDVELEVGIGSGKSWQEAK